MSDAAPSSLAQKLGAEAVGTFALVFVGCGAIAVDSVSGSLTHVGVCIAFGLVVMAMIYATGHICGAHFNPAVTIAFAACRRFPPAWVLPYIVAQILAALAAALLLRLILGAEAVGASATVVHLDLPGAFAVEATITFFLMFVIISVATDYRASGQSAGLAIGGTVLVCALVGGPLTGGSMNPARSIGPALAAAEGLGDLWLYVAAPVLGAGLGALSYHFIAAGSKIKQAKGA